MTKEHYDLIANANCMDFGFVSDGPNGQITKGVQFRPWKHKEVVYYNLAFGDMCMSTGELDDLSKSNNNDRAKILITVATAVLEFTKSFPNALVYAEGSTLARTRLYQMSIASNLEEIKQHLEVYGFLNGRWAIFEKDVNYEAFMVLRK